MNSEGAGQKQPNRLKKLERIRVAGCRRTCAYNHRVLSCYVCAVFFLSVKGPHTGSDASNGNKRNSCNSKDRFFSRVCAFCSVPLSFALKLTLHTHALWSGCSTSECGEQISALSADSARPTGENQLECTFRMPLSNFRPRADNYQVCRQSTRTRAQHASSKHANDRIGRCQWPAPLLDVFFSAFVRIIGICLPSTRESVTTQSCCCRCTSVRSMCGVPAH